MRTSAALIACHLLASATLGLAADPGPATGVAANEECVVILHGLDAVIVLDVELFATISNVRDRALFSLAYGYGLPVGEIVLLDRDDIDLERSRIRIQRLKGGLSGERPIFRSLPLLRQYLESRRDRAEALFPVSRVGSRSAGFRISSASTLPRTTFPPPFATFMSYATRPPSTCSTQAKASTSPEITSATARSNRR